jgi:hypothetical protein
MAGIKKKKKSFRTHRVTLILKIELKRKKLFRPIRKIPKIENNEKGKMVK